RRCPRGPGRSARRPATGPGCTRRGRERGGRGRWGGVSWLGYRGSIVRRLLRGGGNDALLRRGVRADRLVVQRLARPGAVADRPDQRARRPAVGVPVALAGREVHHVELGAIAIGRAGGRELR